jgi:hypothetical protein
MTTLHPDSGYLVIVSMSEFDNIIDNGLLEAMRDMLERIKNKPQGNRYANKYVSQVVKSILQLATGVPEVSQYIRGILPDLPLRH